MGHIIKNTVMRWCRLDTLAQVNDRERIAELKAQGMLVQRQGIGIIIYLEDDFSDFYAKHVYRTDLELPDPVLVRNLVEVPSPREARELVELALRVAVPGPAGGLEAPVPQPRAGTRYDLRIWQPGRVPGQGRFLDPQPIAKQVFRFRDIIRPTSYTALAKSLRDEKGRLRVTRREADNILSIFEESFQKVPYRNPETGELRYIPRMEYTVDYVWVIQKILLYRFDWHGA
jgi:hypothetical protein